MKANWNEIFAQFKQLHVLVVGDVMLDNYWWGDVERVSPEAPVPVVNILSRESRPGGAANVALNCKALGAKVFLASMIGEDENGQKLSTLCAHSGIDTSLLLSSKQRPTTSKTRVIARNHQMIRLDEEVSNELSVEEEHLYIDKVLRFLQTEKPNAVIFEDYNKGVLKENVILRIMQHCKTLGITTAVDPKQKNFFSYTGATIFKPNLKEIREGLQLSLKQPDENALKEAHHLLKDRLQHSISYITLSEQGVFFQDDKEAAIIPTHVRSIADVSGAGDTVIATATLTYVCTRNARLMAELSNLAGGQVCEKAGVVPVDAARLLAEAQEFLK